MAKRGQGEGTIAKRDDGTWWARISLGVDDNGKRVRKAFYGKTRKEVQEKLTAAINEVNNDSYVDPSKMKASKWFEIWTKEYKKNSVKLSTYYLYWDYYSRYVKPVLGSYALKDIRNDMIQKLINDLFAQQLSHSTISKVYSVIYLGLEQAVNNGMITKNLAKNIQTPKFERKETRVLTQDEQDRFIKAVKEIFLGEVFILGLGTGLRIGDGQVKHTLKIFLLFFCERYQPNKKAQPKPFVRSAVLL